LGTSTSRPAEPPRRVWPFTVLALLAVAGLTLAASRSPLFRMRTLEVTGHAHLSRADVIRAGGLDAETNVLWMAPGEIEARLEANPWIAEASVARELPGRVTVRIRERSAIAAIRPSSSSWMLVAGDGTALERVDADPGLPRLVAEGAPGAVPGSRVPRAVLPGVRAVEPMTDWLRARVRTVVLAIDGSIEVRMRGGAVATYGPPTELPAKADALGSVFRWATTEGTRLASIDLRSPGAPTGRPFLPGSSQSLEGSGDTGSR
jgi:cell division septal protein FtsQ